jgi:hypothetical protein
MKPTDYTLYYYEARAQRDRAVGDLLIGIGRYVLRGLIALGKLAGRQPEVPALRHI